jgi:hypothetical protein
MMHRWADDLARLVSDFQSSDLPPASQALVQQVLKATAERIQTWMETP